MSKQPENSGGHVGYYSIDVRVTAKGGPTYRAEAMDIISALDMTFAEGEAFKAVWRAAADRLGMKKEGDSPLRNAEKVKFYGERMVEREKLREQDAREALAAAAVHPTPGQREKRAANAPAVRANKVSA